MSRRRTAPISDAIPHVGAGMCPLPVLVAHGQRPLDHVVGRAPVPMNNSPMVNVAAASPPARSARDVMQSPIPAMNRFGSIPSKEPLSSVCFSQSQATQVKTTPGTSTAASTPRSSCPDTRSASEQVVGRLSQSSFHHEGPVCLGRRRSGAEIAERSADASAATFDCAVIDQTAASSAPSGPPTWRSMANELKESGPVVACVTNMEIDGASAEKYPEDEHLANLYVEETQKLVALRSDKEAELKRLADELAVITASNSEKDEELEHLREKLRDARQVGCGKDTEIVHLQEELAGVTTTISQQCAEVERLQANSRQAKETSSRMDTELLQLQRELEEMRSSSTKARQDVLISEDAPIMQSPSTSTARSARRKHSEVDKENSAHQVVNEQKRLLCALERQLQREKMAAVMPTPSEFMKLAKRLDVEGASQENTKLRQEVEHLHTEVTQMRAYTAKLVKYLPTTAVERLAQEMHTELLPMREQNNVAVLPQS